MGIQFRHPLAARLWQIGSFGMCFGSLFFGTLRADYSAQVIGGENAPKGDYPWMGTLVRSDYDDLAEAQFCGCFLIDSNWLITAAHCVDDLELEDFIIAIGDEDLRGNPRIVLPKMVLLNRGAYNRSARGGDVALIQLKEPITDIEPVSYRRKSDDQTLPEIGKVVGWGLTEIRGEDAPEPTTVLQVAEVPIYEYKDPYVVENWRSEYFPEYIATGSLDPMRGASSGDSGGPLLVSGSSGEDWIAIGIDSWGGSSSSEIAPLSMYTDISYYSDWIDDAIGSNKWNGESFGEWGFQTGNVEEYAEDGLPALRVWPFGSGNERGVEFSDDFLYWQRFEFSLTDPDQWRLNGDGSVTFFPSERFAGKGPLFVRRWESSQPIPRSGPFPLPPHQVVRGSSSFPGYVFDQNQTVFKLEALTAGQSYSIGAKRRFGTRPFFELHRMKQGQMDPIIISSISSGRRRFEFVAEEDAEYWLSIGRRTKVDFDFELYLQESAEAFVSSGVWHEGILEESDFLFRIPGVVMDIYGAFEYISGDVKIEVDSVFDAEMGIYDKLDGSRIGYYDQGAENDLETFIAYGEDLYEGIFRIFNFDPGIYGSYRFRYTPIQEDRTVFVGVDERRAVTRDDRLNENEEGEARYYEWIEISDANLYSTVNVVVNGSSAQLLTGIWDVNAKDYLETDFGDITSYSFEPVEGNRYVVYVSGRRGERNVNYKLTITGDEIDLPDEDDPFGFDESKKELWRGDWVPGEDDYMDFKKETSR